MLPTPSGRTPRGPAAFSTIPRPLRHLHLVLLVAAVVPVVAAQELETDPIEVAEPAVMSDLAVRSLLLDVERAGDRLVVVGERGHILTSDDNGATWTQSPVPTRANLTGVDFADDTTGWAVGHDAVILATDDAGASWSIVYSAPDDEAPLLDVWFADDQTGFAIGAYGTFLETLDGGESWDSRWISESDSHLHQLVRAPDGTLYIAAERGEIYRSDDGGTEWTELPSPYEGSFFGAVAMADDVVLVFGLRGHVFRSEDRGDTWTEISSGTVAMLTDGVAFDDGRIAIVGLGGVLLVSDDDGLTFELRQQPDRLGINAAVIAADGELVVAGEGGVRRLPLDRGAAATD